MKVILPALFAAALLGPPAGVLAQDRFITVQSTTSTQASGLYDHVLPIFTGRTGIEVRVVAVGTGQAIRNAQNCDADLLLVHSEAAEEAFVAAGYGTARTDLMYNDFILIGPEGDPAGVAGMTDIAAALRRIAEAGAPFVSRGDDSGTHKAEQALWSAAGIDPVVDSGGWYRETGSGMGPTLSIAAGMQAYTLVDRATWISFANRGGMRIVLEGDEALFNQYGVIPVSPARCPDARAGLAQVFADWLLSPEGQEAIASHSLAGQQLFYPNAPVR